MAIKKIAVPDRERCVACGACNEECPKGAIRVFNGCYAVVDAAQCVGCGICSRSCPVGCISMEDR